MHGTCIQINGKVVSAHAMQACWGRCRQILLVLNHGSRYWQSAGFTSCVVQVIEQVLAHIWSLSSHILC